jgi:hypothetical protein
LKSNNKPSHQDTSPLTGIDWLDTQNAKDAYEKKTLTETKEIVSVWKDAVERKASDYEIWIAEDIVKSTAMLDWGLNTTVTFDAECLCIYVKSDSGTIVRI